ncbi:MAG: histidine phosphatase family protein [Acidimicrobiales bacterium]
MARLFLVRHGQTELNKAGLLRGEIDVPLDETGEEEARLLGEVFAGVEIGTIVSSPLLRARETARRLAEATNVAVALDERLGDRRYGQWAGRASSEAEELFGSIDAAPGVEPFGELEARVVAAAAGALVAAPAGKGAAGLTPVALVTHDAVLRALLRRLLPPAVSSTRLDLPTGCWCELVRPPGNRPWTAVHLGEHPSNGRRPAAVGVETGPEEGQS